MEFKKANYMLIGVLILLSALKYIDVVRNLINKSNETYYVLFGVVIVITGIIFVLSPYFMKNKQSDFSIEG
ncbi:hypothetical protein [Bacillus sp. AFS017336]|uniref:hypothetical protein n=1 Tax=Bacillus sp. AFS017336 TaxID=2033489 RepID=UPI000BF23A8C|nr:hypothetical protein [Bacillus sp. AFS017336]PEL09896.1 hypothetical protein CN601_15260 [Bacillus sp. AFS017336]